MVSPMPAINVCMQFLIEYRGKPLISPPPPWILTVALRTGDYGDPRGVGVSYGRGTPVKNSPAVRPHTSQKLNLLQGYLAHEKLPPLLGLPQGPRYTPTVGY